MEQQMLLDLINEQYTQYYNKFKQMPEHTQQEQKAKGHVMGVADGFNYASQAVKKWKVNTVIVHKLYGKLYTVEHRTEYETTYGEGMAEALKNVIDYIVENDESIQQCILEK